HMHAGALRRRPRGEQEQGPVQEWRAVPRFYLSRCPSARHATCRRQAGADRPRPLPRSRARRGARRLAQGRGDPARAGDWRAAAEEGFQKAQGPRHRCPHQEGHDHGALDARRGHPANRELHAQRPGMGQAGQLARCLP
ncbi:MAG: hypothetical protein RMY90_10735, partial [Planktomarina sp.]|nr:hypothetical protein [Planktomarina sp.]